MVESKSKHAYPSYRDIAYSFVLCFGVEALAVGTFTALGFSPFWIQVVAVLGGYLSFVLVFFYGYMRSFLVQGEWSSRRIFSDFLHAFLYYLISYPAVFLISFLTLNVLKSLGYDIEIQQKAVQSFIDTKEHPFLHFNQFLMLAVATPFIEEFFFRAMLFSFLRRYLNFWKALLLSSLFFSVVHYMPEQGARNVDILGGLFIFSCFLGALYEKQHSLAAPFFLHSLFNLTAMVLLMFYA